ncbi:MAG: hypothetical protein FWC40_04180 [Proteobacteria bacterium]|nr:hypothetical protein [Pseudomonadota bacterium]
MNNTHKKLGLIGTGVAAVLTLTACFGFEEAYGTPYTEFSLKGKVMDSDDNPIPNVLVAVADPYVGWGASKASCAHGDHAFGTYARCENSTPICDDPSVQPRCEDASEKPYCADESNEPYCVRLQANTTTDAKGEYTLNWQGGKHSESISLVLEDQDGDANGRFDGQSVSIHISDFKKGSCKPTWCSARFSLSKDFVLERHTERPADE